ncbi:hypothetical protein ACFQPG_12220 [Sphingomonas sp. GCM10030256]|uniref:hypothetical protein n=1 Tax=Sphingomonas sp. GCM10030256 TaxID=3273427 RepID=UPI0036127EAB
MRAVEATCAAERSQPNAHPQYHRIPGSPAREYFVLVPSSARKGSIPLVLVHGISRNAIELILRFTEGAADFGVPLIAPLFRQDVYGAYQQVVDRRRQLRADDALFDILAQVAARWPISGDKVDLFGFSGGAQFAHRFALLHPERVRTCVPVSAGWYSWPDEAIDWPLGLRDAPEPINQEAVARLALHIIVGQRDTRADESLRRRPDLDLLQGKDRVKRARRWYKAMRESGLNADCSLTILPRTRHNFDVAQRRGLVALTYSLLGFKSNHLGETL